LDVFLYCFLSCGLISIFIGAAGACYESNVKRLLGFSGMANMGYIFVSLSIGTYSGFYGAIYHFSTYALTLMSALLILMSLKLQGDNLDLKTLTRLEFLSSESLGLSIGLCLMFLSLAGIPPFPGFFGKTMIIFALLEEDYYLTALCVILLSV